MALEGMLFYQIRDTLAANSRKKSEQEQLRTIFTPERSRDTAFASRLKLFWTRFISTNRRPTLEHFRSYLEEFEVENRYDSKYWWEELAPGRSSQCDACGAHISRRLITLSNDSQLIRLGDTCEHHLREDFSLFGLDLEQKTESKKKTRKTKMAAQLEETIHALPGYLASQPEKFLNAIRDSLREEMKAEYREKLEERLQNIDDYLHSYFVSPDSLTRKLLSEMQPDVNFLNTLLANPHLSEEDKLAARKLCGSLSELTAEEAQKIFQQVLCYKYISLPMTLNEVVSDIQYLYRKGKIAEENYRRISPLLDLEEVLVIEALTIANTVSNLRQLRIEENALSIRQYPEFMDIPNFCYLLDWYYDFIMDKQAKTAKPQKEIRTALENQGRPLSDKEVKTLKYCYETAPDSFFLDLFREIPIEKFQETARIMAAISRKAVAALQGLTLRGNYLPVEDLPAAILSRINYDSQETGKMIAERLIYSECPDEDYRKAREENRAAISAGLFPDSKEFLAKAAKAHARIKTYLSLEDCLREGKDLAALLTFIKEVEAAGLAEPHYSPSPQNRFFHPKTISLIEKRAALYRQRLSGSSVEEISKKVSSLLEREVISLSCETLSGWDAPPLRSIHLSPEDLTQNIFERFPSYDSDSFKKLLRPSKLEAMLRKIDEEHIEATPEKRKLLERALSSQDRFLVESLYFTRIVLQEKPSKEKIYFSPAAWEKVEAYNCHLDKIAEYGRSLNRLFSEENTRTMLYCLAENLPLQVDYTESVFLSRVPVHPSSEDWLVRQYQLVKYNDENKQDCRFCLKPFDFSPLIEYGKEFHGEGKRARVTLVNRSSPERYRIGRRFGEVASALPEFHTNRESHHLVTSCLGYKELNGLFWKIYQFNQQKGMSLAVELEE